MTGIENFRELDIWKKAIELVKKIYKITACFPANESYCLTSQLRRCSISIPSNVAEGFRRRYSKEFRRFLIIALGSLAELETQIVIGRELRYLTVCDEKEVLEYIDHIGRMITNLSRSLLRRTTNENKGVQS